MLTIGSLFSGIGGLELGLERAGLGPVKWQVEIDPYCRAVLAKHWPNVERFDDVRKVGAGCLAPVDLICGGFPCQDVSVAGEGAGLAGSRSGLWREFARLAGDLRPHFVVVENVGGLVQRGLIDVLGDLAEIGMDAIWFPLSASDVGAPHERLRIFVVAYRLGERVEGPIEGDGSGEAEWSVPSPWGSYGEGHLRHVADSPFDGCCGVPPSLLRRMDAWPTDLVDRIRAVGNCVVPQVAEVVGWVVRELHGRLTR